MKHFTKNTRSASVAFFMIFILASGLIVAPRPAHAIFGIGDIVADPQNIFETTYNGIISAGSKILANKLVFKEYLLDGVAWAGAKSTLRHITSDMVTDIANGHTYSNGNTGPGFVTNLKDYALQIGDRAAKKTYTDISTDAQSDASAYAKSNANSIGNEVKKAYYKRTSEIGYWATHKETLSKSVANPSKFLAGDFAVGGWDGWNAIDANMNNNPYFAYQNANAAVKTKVSKAITNKKTEVSWGQGILPKTSCTAKKCLIQTPGTVIKAQLNSALSSGMKSLVSADEIDEIIGSLAAGLVSKVIGGGSGSGLIGVAQSSTGGGASYIDKYKNEPPPSGVVKNMTNELKREITSTEKDVQGFISNEQIIYTATNKTVSALQQIINYTPPTNTSTSPPSKCTATLATDVGAAQNAFQGVQTIYTQTLSSLVGAQHGLTVLEKLYTLSEAIATSATSATQTGQTGDIQEISNTLQQLTTSGLLPSVQQISDAQTESMLSPSGAGTVSSSGTAGLTVTGGTTVDRMNLLTKKASAALKSIEACFSSGGSGS